MPQNIAEIVSKKNDLEALKTLQPVVYELEFDKNNVFGNGHKSCCFG